MECIVHLEVISTKSFVKVIWIPGHEGHIGNEKADLLARQGDKNTADPHKVEVSTSLQIIKSRLDTWLTDSPTKEWTKENTAKHTKEVWKYYSRKKTLMLLKLNRDEMQSTIAFTAGHVKFKAHLVIAVIVEERIQQSI